MKILEVYWFNGGGIVRVQTEYDGIKYYIRGIPPEMIGDPDSDAQFIADYGSTFSTAAGDALFGMNAE
jgi:hypothetical protein